MSALDTQFLTADELQTVLETLKTFNERFHPTVVSEVSPMNPLVLTDSNGEVIGSIDYNEDVQRYVFQYPADTIRAS